jgi:hypothetical protein
MIARMNRRLIDYIVEVTGVDRETVMKILQAEEDFLAGEIERMLRDEPPNGGA